jgi:hypothetical protein
MTTAELLKLMVDIAEEHGLSSWREVEALAQLMVNLEEPMASGEVFEFDEDRHLGHVPPRDAVVSILEATEIAKRDAIVCQEIMDRLRKHRWGPAEIWRMVTVLQSFRDWALFFAARDPDPVMKEKFGVEADGWEEQIRMLERALVKGTNVVELEGVK